MRRGLSRRWMLVIIVFCCGILGALAASGLYANWYVVDSYEIPVTFRVAEGSRIGFDLNTTILAFGTVPRGGDATRTVTLAASVPAIAYVRPRTAWIASARVALEPGVPVDLPLTLAVPKDAAPGNYTSGLRITYVRRLR